MENEKPEEEKLPLTSHLEELKTRLIRILIVVGIGFGVCYLFKDWSFRVITKPLVDAMPAQSSMIFTGLPEAFFIHMKIAFFASLFLTAPYTLFEIWRFVSPGLYKNEKRFVFPFVFFSTILFVGGVLFGYFIALPPAFSFFVSFSTDFLKPMISFREYLSLTLKFLLAFGLCFEMPVFMFFLAKTRHRQRENAVKTEALRDPDHLHRRRDPDPLSRCPQPDPDGDPADGSLRGEHFCGKIRPQEQTRTGRNRGRGKRGSEPSMTVKRSAPRRRRSSSRHSLLGIIIVAILVLFVAAALAGSSLIYYVLLKELPSIAALKDYRPSITTRVYADNNELIDEFFLEDRKVIKYEEIPKMVIQAFVASEDARFFQHGGFDMQSMSRAFFKNLEAGKIVQGGSTITQQVAKSLYLSPEKSYMRKIKEALLAYKIDRYLTKEEIITLYLNHIYLGHGTYGIEAAAQGYFGKSARDLTLPEAAMLAGLPKAPSNYSPYLHPDRAYQRQAYVLNRMLEDGYITPAREGPGALHVHQTPLDQAEGQDRPLFHRKYPPLHPGEVRQRRPLQGGPRGLHDPEHPDAEGGAGCGGTGTQGDGGTGGL